MLNQNPTCIDQGMLGRFLHEELDESEESDVLSHLDRCQACQQALEGIAADGTLWSDLRKHFSDPDGSFISTKTSGATHGIVESVMDFLGPTDDPNRMGRIGPYEVGGVVGRGSTGVVLKAVDGRLNRFVAIKVLAPNFASSGSARARFEREARAVAAVAHEHVVPIFSVNEFRGLPYLVMQFVGGGSLQQRIDRVGPLEVCEVVRIGMQVASGLAAAHAQGIVHRDVKPANVLLECDVERAVVTDFGLARVADEASMTRSGAITGTPQFMSPEQAKGEFVDHRSDLFSLGSLLYTACTGRPPFRSETVYGVIRRVCESKIRPVREINPDIPVWLESFIDKLCAKNREDRFDSAKLVCELLSTELAHLQSPMIHAPPKREWIPSSKQASKSGNVRTTRLTFTALIAMAVLTLSIGSAWRIWNNHPRGNSSSDSSASAVARYTWNPHNLPEFTSTVTRAVPVEPNGRLKLIAGFAQVEIRPSHCKQLEIRVKRKVAAPDELTAKSILETHHMQFQLDKQGMTVESNIDSDDPSWRQQFGQFQVQVFVPDQYSVDIETKHGDITAKRIGGNLIASTEGGDLNIDSITGFLSAKTHGGSLRVKQVQGNARVETGKGDLHLEHVGNGIFAKTTSGKMTLPSINGVVRATTVSGNIEVGMTGQPQSGCEILTDRGHVIVNLSQQLSIDLQAITPQGEILSPFTTLSQSPITRLNQQINEGGTLVSVKSSQSNIEFRFSADSNDILKSHKKRNGKSTSKYRKNEKKQD